MEMPRRILLSLCIIFTAFMQVTKSGTTRPEVLDSRAWYVLRQWNAGPLLLGMPQRLGKVIESVPRHDSIWTGIEQGGSLKLKIEVEGDVTEEIFVGLFQYPDWSSEPVQIRSFPKAGEYIINNLPSGLFHIGAMIGALPVTTALGVQQMWPESIEIERGKINSAKVLVSPDFQRRASGWYNQDVSKDFIGDWKDMDTDNLLQGRVTGPDGQPVAFATVQIREYKPGAGSIKAPNRGTNEQGYYKYDGINWPYTIGVLRYQSMPFVHGYRHQYLFYNHVFEGSETVKFQFENPPEGNATVKGYVKDQRGNPLEEFFITISTKINWDVRKNPDGKFYSSTGYRMPFISQDGSFKLNNLPAEDVNVRVVPFDIQKYDMNRGKQVQLEADKTTTINLEVVSKNILHGRVLFRDGSPAVIKPTPWPGAKTSIMLSMGFRARGLTEVDDEGYFSAYLSDREVEMLKSGKSRLIINVPTSEERRNKNMGDFPFEKLAIDKEKARTLKIDYPDKRLRSLTGKSIPGFEGIDIAFDIEQARNKMILICFFDMEQRPSRNCLMRLVHQAESLKEKGILISAIHATKVQQTQLKGWIKENKITFPTGIITGQEEQVRFNWGVKSLPWLILTNKKHQIISSGFSLTELDDKIQTTQK